MFEFSVIPDVTSAWVSEASFQKLELSPLFGVIIIGIDNS